VALPKYSLKVLGRFELSGPDGPVELSNKKLAGLLAYLACSAPDSCSREKLATLLWGSHFETQARQNLRQALYRLRRALGPDALVGEGDEIALSPAVVECDVAELKAIKRDGDTTSLSGAAALYRDRLLSDVEIPEEAWSDWLEPERRRLEGLALDAMVGYAERELRSGNAEAALKTAHRAIDVNGLREDAHRLVVQALAATGRRAEALKHYQDLVAVLKRELNTEPDALTKALVAELRSQPPDRLSATEAAKLALEAKATTPATPGDQPSQAAARSVDLERRQLTIMVCNMVGSAPLSALLDPEGIHDLLVVFHRKVVDGVAPFGGFVAQYQGTGVHVYFGYPAAREHDAEQAVRAALATLDAVGSLSSSSGVAFRASVGIASGLVVVGDERDSEGVLRQVAIGEPPNIATRVQAEAAPGEIVIAASTRQLVGQLFDCRPLDPIEVKGLTQPIEAWRVCGVAAGVSRFDARRTGRLSPLVDRQEEFDLLRRRWQQAKLGEGRVLLLSGEPGIGKSRLAESLVARLEGEPHARLRYFCSPHHARSPCFPVIAQLKQAADFAPGDAESAKLDKLEALLKPTSKNLPRDAALISELMGLPAGERYPTLTLSPRQKREMSLAVLLDQISGLGKQGPVLIVLEDAHWIDPTSLDLLDSLISRIADLPMLLVVTFRPEFQPAWVGQANVTTVLLGRLGRRDSAALIGGLIHDKALSDSIVEQIFASTDGVPLFLEELTATLLESGLLHENPDGYVLDRPRPGPVMPTTLQGSLVARLDRLGPGKDVAVIGAAIGRDFSHELIAAVSARPPADLGAALDRLTSSGLVSRRGLPPDAVYSFKHALVRDAAYGTMLRSRRRQLHSSIAQALVEQFPALADSQPEIVALHYTEAGLATEAIGYWRKAGKLAAGRGAFAEAQQAYQAALSILLAMPSSSDRDALELPLQGSLADVLRVTRGYSAQETISATTRARALSEQKGDITQQFSQAVGMWAAASSSGDYGTARQFADQVLELALVDRSEVSLAHAHMIQMTSWFRIGNLLAAEGYFERGEHLFRSPEFRKQPGWAAQTYGNAAIMAWIMGDQVKSQQRIDKALSSAQENDSPYDLAFAQYMAALLAVLTDNLPVATRFAENSIQLSHEHGFPQFAPISKIVVGRATAASGAPAEGIALIREGLKGMAGSGSRVGMTVYMTWLADAELLGGLVGDSLHTAEQALNLNPQELFFRPASLQLRGDLHARKGLYAKAERDFREAMDLSTRMGAKRFYDRAAERLQRLMNEQLL